VAAAVAAVASLEADQATGLASDGDRVSEGSSGIGSHRIHHGFMFAANAFRSHGPESKLTEPRLYARAMSAEGETVLRPPVPGRLYEVVKRASYLELALFAALLVVWIAPGFEGATAALGLAHGLGVVALAILIWYAAIRHEAPYTLLAATLTPVGPVGSVIAIHYIDRKYAGKKGGPS
jgi:hypothetical protein